MSSDDFDIDSFETQCSICREYPDRDVEKQVSYPKWHLRGRQPGESACFVCRRRERLKQWFEHIHEGGTRTFQEFDIRHRRIINRHGRKNKK
jgi:hypothetical protein